MSWLLSSISDSILPRLVDCETSFQIWVKLDIYFASQTGAKVGQFKDQLKAPKKGSLSINAYLSKIKACVDSLTSVGCILSEKEHIDAILDGLFEEYDTFITAVNTRTEAYTIEEVESLLMAQEARIEKNHRELDSSLSANVAFSGHSRSGRSFFSGPDSHSGGNFQPNQRNTNFGGRFCGFQGQNFNGSGRGYPFSSRGGGNRNQSPYGHSGGLGNKPNWHNNAGSSTGVNTDEAPPVCQLCRKVGHEVDRCYYRFDTSFAGFSRGFQHRNQRPRSVRCLFNNQQRCLLLQKYMRMILGILIQGRPTMSLQMSII